MNGSVKVYPPEQLPLNWIELLTVAPTSSCPAIECWVVIEVDEAYIHCSKHVPRLEKATKAIDWGTDDPVKKSDCFFLE